MIELKVNTNQFMKDMDSIMKYSIGFLEGAQDGKTELLKTIGEKTSEILEQFIDANARANPSVLHHIYEWSEVGNPSARLFNLEYFVAGGGLTFKSTFSQSSSVRAGSSVPFYDKARIMEDGIPVVIRPKAANVLSFEDDGQQVFTKGPVSVSSPGGSSTNGGFQETVDMFFNSYWRQSFLETTGISDILRNPIQFKQNLPRAKAGGRAKGYDIGYRWISAGGAR